MASLDKFDDRRLREEALKAFVKALHTDRMVAITGAMSTRALGYPSWNEFIAAYAEVALELATKLRTERENQPGFKDAMPLTPPVAELLGSRSTWRPP